MQRLKILTWPSDLWSLKMLSQTPHDFYLPVPGILQGAEVANLFEVPKSEVPGLNLDAVVFQSESNYAKDQFQVLSSRQLQLPQIFWQQQAPSSWEEENAHPVLDPDVVVVHSSSYSQLMWDHAPGVKSKVIEPGMKASQSWVFEGDWERGLSLCHVGRIGANPLGQGLLEKAQGVVPLDLIRLKPNFNFCPDEILPSDFPRVCGHYRFLFSALRRGSLDLSFYQALMTGLPVIGVACGELVNVIDNGRSGFLHTDFEKVISAMKEMIKHPLLAREWGKAARKTAMERFHLDRFIKDWNRLLSEMTGVPFTVRSVSPSSALLSH
jgi:glycosyltransferase involved in cell wall biosynthesis